MFSALLHKVGIGIAGLGLAISSYFTPQVIVQKYYVPQHAPPASLGAAIPIATARFETSLASGIASTDTSMTLTTASTTAGASISGYYCFTIDEGTTSSEFVCGTASGITISSMLRGIDPIDGDLEVTALKKSHRRGASVKVTDFPVLGIISRIVNGDETLPNILQYSTSSATSTQGNNIFNLASVGYVNSVASSGAANAFFGTVGLVDLATTSQALLGTATSGASIYLAVPNVLVKATSSALSVSSGTIPIARKHGTGASTTIESGFIDTQADYSYSGVFSSNGTTTLPNVASLSVSTATSTATSTDKFNLLPAGVIQMYASSTAPAGWLLCDGTAYTTSTYPRLWQVVGTVYGGSGSNFNVPNIGGRFVSAPSSTLSTTLGAIGGATSTSASVGVKSNLNGTGGGGSGAALITGGSGDTITSTGTVAIIPPYIILNYIIKY